MKVLDSSGLWYMTELLRNNFNNINQKITQGDNNVLNYVNGSFKSGLLTTDDASVYLKKNGDTANTLTINSTFIIGGTVGLNGGYGISSYFAPRPLTNNSSTLLRRTLTFDVSTYKPWVMGPINDSTGFVIGQAVGHFDIYGAGAAVHPYFKIDASGNVYENNELLKDKYALKTDISTAIADLVNSAPETLNTLDELATALGDDPNFATTVATELGKKANASDLNNYLPLSGGTMTGNLVTKQISVEAGNWVVTYGPGISLQRADGPSYIWNTASKSIAIGTDSIGQSSELNASLVINGTNIYPGTSNKFSLGTDSYKFKDIFADGVIKGGRFLYGTKTKAELESINNAGLSIVAQVPLNGSTAGDYGFNATNNANGVLAFRTHAGSGANYMHYLGFSDRGLYYRSNISTNNTWVNLNSPSMLSINNPGIEYSSTGKIIPELIHGNIVNVFHEVAKANIKIERSQDGTTWTDTTETDYSKCKQVMSTGRGGEALMVAYDRTNGKVGDRLRITINGAHVYCNLSYLYVYYTTIGATTKLTLEKNKQSAPDTWTTIIDKQSCTGWSGPNYYGLNGSIMGQPSANGDNGYSYRITFEITAAQSGYSSVGKISNIWAFSTFSPYSINVDSRNMFYYNVNREKYSANKSIEPRYDVTYTLGSTDRRWSNVYAKDFHGIFHTTNGTASQVVLGDGALKAISDFTDTKVTQTLTSSNANYPILLAPTDQNATTTTISYFDSGISCNPSLNALNVDMINVKNSSTGGIIYFGDKNNDNDGFVYITEDESDKLCLAGDLGITFKTGFNNDGGDIVFDIWPYDEDRAAIRPYTSSANVRAIDIGRDSARFTNAYFSGTIYAATSFMQSSDERLKDFGPELEVNLDELSKLRKSYFTFKDKPEDLQIGVSAQEIQKLYPEIVSETDDGYLNVDYAKLSVIALAAIDKLNEEIKELKKLINK